MYGNLHFLCHVNKGKAHQLWEEVTISSYPSYLQSIHPNKKLYHPNPAYPS